MERKTPKPRFITIKEFQEEIRSWSTNTIRRRIKDSGLPYIQEADGICFDRQAVHDWFKRREIKAG